MPENSKASEQIAFPMSRSPIGAFFIVVPALIIVVGAIAQITTKMPLLLRFMILAVMASCIVLLKSAIEEMCDISVEWSAQGVTVKNLFGATTYYWSQVERVELFDPGATFGDMGRHEETRHAIGLYIRNPDKQQRADGDPPDVMVVSRAGSAGDTIPKLVERLSTAKRYGGGKDARKLGGTGNANGSRSAKAFRRPVVTPAA